jgi:hypothetical protein
VSAISGDRPKRALVASTERSFCVLLSEVLRTLDVASDHAASVHDALRLFGRNRYNLALMDAGLCDPHGVPVSTALSLRFGFGRRIWGPVPPRLPPILVFSRSMRPELARQFLFGEAVAGCLKRPVRVEQVRLVVRDLLEWQEVRAKRHAHLATRMAQTIWQTDGQANDLGETVARGMTETDALIAPFRGEHRPPR